MSAPRHIGDRPLSLIPHLKATIDLLLDQGRSGYVWSDCSRCNAGLLARTILGYTREELLDGLSEIGGGGKWDAMMRSGCPHNPDKCWPDLLQRLLDAGLEPGDPAHLEGLTHVELMDPTWKLHPSVSCAMQPDGYTMRGAYNDPACVAAYLLRWVAAIEVFHAARQRDEADAATLAYQTMVVLPAKGDAIEVSTSQVTELAALP